MLHDDKNKYWWPKISIFHNYFHVFGIKKARRRTPRILKILFSQNLFRKLFFKFFLFMKLQIFVCVKIFEAIKLFEERLIAAR